MNAYAATFTPIPHQSTYQIYNLYDTNVAKRSGSTFPIKIQLGDSAGNNLSSSSVIGHDVSVTRVSANTPTILDDTGNANPDFDFRYDSSLAGYIFNLSTSGYLSGTYSPNFTAGADPTVHAVIFSVR